MLESKTTEELVLPNGIDESKVSFESTMQVLDGEGDTENDPEGNNIDNEMTAEEKLARARQLVSTMEKAIADVMDGVEGIIGSGSIQIPGEDLDSSPAGNNIDNEMTAEEKLAGVRQLMFTMKGTMENVMNGVEGIIGFGSIQIPGEDSDSSSEGNNIDNEMTTEEKLAGVRQLMSTMKETIENVMNLIEGIIGSGSIQIPGEDSDSSSEGNNIDNGMTAEEKLAGVRQLMSTMKETIENVMNGVEGVIGSGSIQIPGEE